MEMKLPVVSRIRFRIKSDRRGLRAILRSATERQIKNDQNLI